MIKTKTLTIKIKNDLETDDNVMVDIDTDSGEAIDDIKDEDDNKNDAINNDMDTDGNVEVDIDTDNGDAIDIKDEDDNANDDNEAQSFINKEMKLSTQNILMS